MATNTLFFRLKIQNLDKSLINTLRKRLQIFLGFMNHISRERLKGVVVLVEEAASYYEQKDFLAVSHKLQEAFRLMEKLYEQSSDDDRFQYSLRSFMMECCLLMIVCLEEDRLSKEAADHSLWSANNKVFREGKVIAKVRTDGTIEGDISNPDVANALADVLLMKALRVDSICGRSNDSLPGNRSLITD